MKITKKITPYIILILLAFAQIIDTSSVTKLARRQIKRKNAMRDTTFLEPINTMSVWQAFKSGKKINYLEMVIGFIGAWEPTLAGQLITLTSTAAFTTVVYPLLEARCITPDKTEGTTPISGDMLKVAEKGAESIGAAEKSTDAEACQAIGGCDVATENVPARAGFQEFAGKAFAVFEGVKNFKDCFIAVLEENKAVSAAVTKIIEHLYNWLSLSYFMSIVKLVVKFLTGGASTVFMLTVNFIKFGIILYRAVTKWRKDGKIAFPMVGTLFGLVIKTIFDLVAKKRRFRKR